MPIDFAEQREGAVFHQKHAAAAAQFNELRHRLRPARVVNDVQKIRIVDAALPFDVVGVELHRLVEELEGGLGLAARGGDGAPQREHLGGAVITIVDQVIESGEILRVAAHTPGARGTPSEDEGRHPDHQETQQQDFGADTAQTHARTLSEKATHSAKIARHEKSLVSCADHSPHGRCLRR